MSNSPDKMPVPHALAEAFEEAISILEDWDRGGPLTREVSYEMRPYSVEAICILTEAYGGNAPDYTYDYVRQLSEEFRGSPAGLGHDCSEPKDHSYQQVAICLRRLHDARADYYKRKEANRT